MSDKKKIVLVDDEIHIINLLEVFIQDQFDVIKFEDPQEAISFLQSESVDLVMTDMKMPGSSGKGDARYNRPAYIVTYNKFFIIYCWFFSF